MAQPLNQHAAILGLASGRLAADRRIEAERLIDLAKALLTGQDEEIAAIYLDHALDVLRAIPAELAMPSASDSTAS